MRHEWLMAVASLLATASPAYAEKEFCPDRPGKGDPACTLAAGRLQVETSLADWAHTQDAEETQDTILLNDALVRYGLTDATELRLGWTMMGVDRTRERGGGRAERATRAGDVVLGVRQSLHDAGEGRGLSIAVQPEVSLPAGRAPIGAGTWGAALVVPMQVDIDKDWTATLDTEVDAAPDEDGDGRHLAYSAVFDLLWNATERLQLGGEAFVQRDRDPEDHATLASLDAMAAYKIGDDSQVDFGAYAGLTRATPRIQLVLGLAHRF